jgi:ferrochelatase
MKYDAILVVSFGGPESREEVIPFLENVLRGRNVPRGRMLAVAEHYYHFEGKSPINQQVRELISALQTELEAHGIKLPIYWGNRNWHPLLADTLRKMEQDGVKRAIGFVTSAYSSYSGCRQYREDIVRAQNEIGAGAPAVDKIRVFFNHPGFIEATVDRVGEALASLPGNVKDNLQIVYTAHSIPVSMAESSDYVKQLEEVRHLVSQAIGTKNDALVYQSRSGAPGQPWLGPDVLDYLREIKTKNLASAVEARDLCNELNLPMSRAKTVGVHPNFIAMIRELIEERMNPESQRRSSGSLGVRPDACAENCCPAPQRTPQAQVR